LLDVCDCGLPLEPAPLSGPENVEASIDREHVQPVIYSPLVAVVEVHHVVAVAKSLDPWILFQRLSLT
jgi:hypothetical protein